MLSSAYFTPDYFGAFVISGAEEEIGTVGKMVCGSITITAAIEAMVAVRTSMGGEPKTRPAVDGSTKLGKCA